jgi:cytidylate kinase
MDGKSDTRIHSGTDARIAAHVHAWEAATSMRRRVPLGTQPFVTISREFGCGAYLVAQRLVELLNERFRPSIPWLAYGRDVMEPVAQDLHLHREIVESITERRRGEIAELLDSVLNRKVDEALVVRKLAEVIRSLAMHGQVVLVGRGGYLITADLKTGLHVRLVAPREWRIHHVATERGLTPVDAAKFVERSEAERARFLQTFFVRDRSTPVRFDLIIDCSRFSRDQVAELILGALELRFGRTLAASSRDAS